MTKVKARYTTEDAAADIGNMNVNIGDTAAETDDTDARIDDTNVDVGDTDASIEDTEGQKSMIRVDVGNNTGYRGSSDKHEYKHCWTRDPLPVSSNEVARRPKKQLQIGDINTNIGKTAVEIDDKEAGIDGSAAEIGDTNANAGDTAAEIDQI